MSRTVCSQILLASFGVLLCPTLLCAQLIQPESVFADRPLQVTPPRDALTQPPAHNTAEKPLPLRTRATDGASKAGGSTRRNTNRTEASPFWTTIGSLALVVALIVILARLWKKHGRMVGTGIPAEAVELLGKRHIDQQQAICLVRLGSRILVLGSSPNGLQTLSEISDPVEVDYLAGLCRQPNTDAAHTFRSLFQRHPTTQNTDQTPGQPSSPVIHAGSTEQPRDDSQSRADAIRERMHG